MHTPMQEGQSEQDISNQLTFEGVHIDLNLATILYS